MKLSDEFGFNNFGTAIWQGTRLTLPIYPWYDDKTKQVYDVNIFKEMQRFEVTFKELHDMLESYVKWRNDTFGRHFDNNNYFLVRENKRFSFLIDTNNYSNCKLKNSFSLWNDNNESLGGYIIDVNLWPSDEFVEWIEDTTERYCIEKVNCSACGKEITYNEITGRYFAGVYCKDCWENKYKEIEAKETYE